MNSKLTPSDAPRALRNDSARGRVLPLTGIPLLAIVASLVATGCSTTNVNPPAPRADTGYVDFYTDSNFSLCWEVKRENQNTGEMRTVFSKYKPVEGTILRLPAPPGAHRFQLWFYNQVTEGPEIVSVQVAEGKVTPVHVTLTPTRNIAVESKDYEYRPTARATRRVTRIVTDQGAVFRIGVAAGTPQVYQPKEQMPYCSSAAK